MPDWERLVAERLAHIRLPPEERREIVTEIAAHLVECHAELVKAGSPDPENQTLAQVADWAALSRRIRRAKEDRMKFARQVIVPAALAVMMAIAALKLFVSLLIAPQPCAAEAGADCVAIIVSADGPAYLPWLALLPFVGAFAAHLARRLGARPAHRLLAAVSPALYLSGEMFVMGLVSGFFWRIPIYWVIIPALLCALGAWPFLGGWRGGVGRRPVPAV